MGFLKNTLKIPLWIRSGISKWVFKSGICRKLWPNCIQKSASFMWHKLCRLSFCGLWIFIRKFNLMQRMCEIIFQSEQILRIWKDSFDIVDWNISKYVRGLFINNVNSWGRGSKFGKTQKICSRFFVWSLKSLIKWNGPQRWEGVKCPHGLWRAPYIKLCMYG